MQMSTGSNPGKRKAKAVAKLPAPSVKKKAPYAVKLESMTCWPQVRDMLSEGYTIQAIAAFIHDEAQERRDVKSRTLEDQLFNYRREHMPSAAFAGAVGFRQAGWLRKRMEDEELEYGRLEEMYRIQKSRVDLGLAYEQRVGMPLAVVGQAAQQTVETICRMAALKDTYGFNRGGKGGTVVISQSVVMNVQQRFGDEVAAVLQRPAARGRVLALLEEFKALGDDEGGDLYGISGPGEIIDLEDEGDGEPAPQAS